MTDDIMNHGGEATSTGEDITRSKFVEALNVLSFKSEIDEDGDVAFHNGDCYFLVKIKGHCATLIGNFLTKVDRDGDDMKALRPWMDSLAREDGPIVHVGWAATFYDKVDLFIAYNMRISKTEEPVETAQFLLEIFQEFKKVEERFYEKFKEIRAQRLAFNVKDIRMILPAEVDTYIGTSVMN